MTKIEIKNKVGNWFVGNIQWLVTILITSIGVYITITTTIHDLQNQNNNQESRIEALEKDSLDAKLQLTEIKTLLKSVDTNIIELKTRLK